MYLKENFLLAITSIRSNKMRSLLTMLGIIIGIGSVIAILSIGNALTASFSSMMSDLGANNIYVEVVEKTAEFDEMGYGYSNKTPEDSDRITMEDIERFQDAFAEQLDGVAVSAYEGTGKAQDGRLYANVELYGVNADYALIENLDLINGRFLTEKDVDAAQRSIVVSDKFVNNMFGVKDPLGQTVNLYVDEDIYTYTIVGVYKYKTNALMGGGSFASEKDMYTSAYIPVTIVKEEAEYKNFSYIIVRAKPEINAAEFTVALERYFERLYARNSNFRCEVFNMESMLESMTGMLTTVSLGIAAIAAIALLVGGIGVMNIMLVSVTERTREIGTRKALGARNAHIRMQFIVESVIVSIIGGVIGILVGSLIAVLGCMLLATPPSISLSGVVISVCFSMAIGIFFGYYPANKAAKLDAIDALRYE